MQVSLADRDIVEKQGISGINCSWNRSDSIINLPLGLNICISLYPFWDNDTPCLSSLFYSNCVGLKRSHSNRWERVRIKGSFHFSLQLTRWIMEGAWESLIEHFTLYLLLSGRRASFNTRHSVSNVSFMSKEINILIGTDSDTNSWSSFGHDSPIHCSRCYASYNHNDSLILSYLILYRKC